MTPQLIAWLEAAKDVVVTLAAAIGAIVAMIGLSTWHRQLKGQSDHELARRILVSLYKYRDAIRTVRNPFMMSAEIPHPPDQEAKSMTQAQVRYYGTSHAYQKRWDKLSEQRNELYADTLEAEALWGDELKNLLAEILKLEHELASHIQDFLSSIDPDDPESLRTLTPEERAERRKAIYGTMDDKEPFMTKFGAAVQKIEKYLRPKLVQS